MPELPELQALAESLDAALPGRGVTAARLWQAAALKSAEPALEALVGRRVGHVWRRGKLIGIDIDSLALVIHLMQAGRLALEAASGARPTRTAVLDLVLDDGTRLRLRELSREHRASAHVLRAEALDDHPPLARLGPEPLGLSAAGWRSALGPPPARLHQALRDGRRVAGIGRAYASDLMWAARLPPFALADRLDDEQIEHVRAAAETVLGQALDRARARISTSLPDREARVTAVHGHYGEPCLRCATRLERVSFRDYELVYCPRCQTAGRIYADRRRSRFLR